MKLAVPALLALLLLTSCGSKDGDLVEEPPVPESPAGGGEMPPLIPPDIPMGPPNSAAGNPFRVPEVTNELPEEKALLSRPVTSPPSGANVNTQ